ncbi:MAG: hypothetical protein ACLT5X_12915, partial [Blautia producta]
PQAPEACASANSATPAFLMKFCALSSTRHILHDNLKNVNTKFQKNLNFFECCSNGGFEVYFSWNYKFLRGVEHGFY